MDDGLKQRIVGALVLLALLVIFLPVLFDRNRVEPVDRSSQIPPAIVPPPAPIQAPAVPQVSPTEVAPAPDQMFVPEESTAIKVEPSQAAKNEPAKAKTEMVKVTPDDAKTKAGEIKVKPDEPKTKTRTGSTEGKNPPKISKSEAIKPSAELPKLNTKGSAEAWILQVSSYKSGTQASKLRDELNAKGFNAYIREVASPKGPIIRVFVGPKFDKTTALEQKKRLDELFKLNVLVLPYTPTR